MLLDNYIDFLIRENYSPKTRIEIYIYGNYEYYGSFTLENYIGTFWQEKLGKKEYALTKVYNDKVVIHVHI